MEKFHIKFEDECNFLTGILDEHSVITNLRAAANKIYHLDFRRTHQVTQAGCQKLGQILSQLVAQNQQITLSHVNSKLVALLNAHPHLLPSQVNIQSVYLPFECETCEGNDDIPYRCADLAMLDLTQLNQSVKCKDAQCSNRFREPDLNLYLKFLKKLPS